MTAKQTDTALPIAQFSCLTWGLEEFWKKYMFRICLEKPKKPKIQKKSSIFVFSFWFPNIRGGGRGGRGGGSTWFFSPKIPFEGSP